MSDSASQHTNKSIEVYQNSPYEQFASYDRFKFVMEFLRKRVIPGQSLLDIGCAKGEFIYCAKDSLPTNTKFTGLEYSQLLIDIAQKEEKLKDVYFKQGDAQNFELEEQFDHVMMSGVLSIFDDIKPPIERLFHHLRPGGYGYIFGCFNSDNIDVLVKFKNKQAGSNEYEAGLNLFSLETVRDELKTFSKQIAVHHFNLSVDLPKQENPVASYTLNTKEKGKIILNGANIVTDFYLFEFQKNSTKP